MSDEGAKQMISDEALLEAIADAIERTDTDFNMELVKLVDGAHTYRLSYPDGQILEFCDDETDDFDAQDRLYAHVRVTKRRKQSEAVLSAMLYTSPTPAERVSDEVTGHYAGIPKDVWEAAGLCISEWTIDDGRQSQFDACRESVAHAILADRAAQAEQIGLPPGTASILRQASQMLRTSSQMSEGSRSFLFAMLGSDTWLEAGMVWDRNPEARKIAYAEIAAGKPWCEALSSEQGNNSGKPS